MSGEIREVADAGAVRTERAAECRQHRQILFQDGGEVKIHTLTGIKQIIMPPRRRPEIPQKYIGAVPGLTVLFYDSEIRFEWFTDHCVDAADCVDAQCRAGWNDDSFGFYGLETGIMPDGRHRSKWSCWTVACD